MRIVAAIFSALIIITTCDPTDDGEYEAVPDHEKHRNIFLKEIQKVGV